HGKDIVRALERIPGWNFVVAPHVKLVDGPSVQSSAENVLIDRGRTRSIHMSYTEAAQVYIGDVSSQVYEFLRRPRPCIFLNPHRFDWRGDANFAHWSAGPVVAEITDLGRALEIARTDHAAVYRPAQQALFDHTFDL